MRELSPIFRRASIQVLHAILMPVFFILFVLLYKPFNIVEVLDMGRELYPFNITMITCIILVSISLMRSIFFTHIHNIYSRRDTLCLILCGAIYLVNGGASTPLLLQCISSYALFILNTGISIFSIDNLPL